MAIPRIGITAGKVTNKIESFGPTVQGQSETYLDAIVRAGGAPSIIPSIENEVVLRTLYDNIDGILFAGGNDINPKHYGEARYKEVTDVDDLRDIAEMKLMKWALDDCKPIFGICRGMQLLNVVKGGSCYQDIATDFGDKATDHTLSTKRESLEDIAHRLRIDPNSQLYGIVGQTIGANTHHHQAVKKLGNGIVANAWSEDGLIEGIELRDAGWAVGIQAHPESLEVKEEMRWRKLFAAFVAASMNTIDLEEVPTSDRVLTTLLS